METIQHGQDSRSLSYIDKLRKLAVIITAYPRLQFVSCTVSSLLCHLSAFHGMVSSSKAEFDYWRSFGGADISFALIGSGDPSASHETADLPKEVVSTPAPVEVEQQSKFMSGIKSALKTDERIKSSIKKAKEEELHRARLSASSFAYLANDGDVGEEALVELDNESDYSTDNETNVVDVH